MELSEELERLSELHAAGKLSDEEYATAKAKLLSGDESEQSAAPPPPPSPQLQYAAQAPDKSGMSVIAIVLVVLVALVAVPLLAIFVITFFGRSASSEFKEVGSAVSGVVVPALSWFEALRW